MSDPVRLRHPSGVVLPVSDPDRAARLLAGPWVDVSAPEPEPAPDDPVDDVDGTNDTADDTSPPPWTPLET